MAEEEKNSSHNSSEPSRPNRENTFRLHYFPEIPADGSDSHRNGQGTGTSFRRMHHTADDSQSYAGEPITGTLPLSGLSEQQIREIETRAYIQGFNKGESEGYAAAERKTGKALTQLSTQLNKLAALRKQIYRESETEIVELVLAIVRKVICEEVRTNPEVIVGVLKEALKKVESQQQLLVRMHPKDLEFLEHNRVKLAAVIEEAESVRLETDSSIGRGGCLIETESGTIDARIEKQLKVIEDSFIGQNRKKTE